MQILLRAFLIVVILAVVLLFALFLYKRSRPVRNAHFICPYCGNIAMPGRLVLSISPARADYRLLQCGACKRFGYMTPVWDA